MDKFTLIFKYNKHSLVIFSHIISNVPFRFGDWETVISHCCQNNLESMERQVCFKTEYLNMNENISFNLIQSSIVTPMTDSKCIQCGKEETLVHMY